MPAEKGEKCGVCASKQNEGAYICHSCHAEREVCEDYSLTGRLKGAATGCVSVFVLLFLANLVFKFHSPDYLLLYVGALVLGMIWGWKEGSTKIVWIKIGRNRSLEIY